jgi:hypothetical protein
LRNYLYSHQGLKLLPHLCRCGDGAIAVSHHLSFLKVNQHPPSCNWRACDRDPSSKLLPALHVPASAHPSLTFKLSQINGAPVSSRQTRVPYTKQSSTSALPTYPSPLIGCLDFATILHPKFDLLKPEHCLAGRIAGVSWPPTLDRHVLIILYWPSSVLLTQLHLAGIAPNFALLCFLCWALPPSLYIQASRPAS